MAELIEMPFWQWLRHVRPRNHILDGGQLNPFATVRCDKVAVWPLAKLLLDTCYSFFHFIVFK